MVMSRAENIEGLIDLSRKQIEHAKFLEVELEMLREKVQKLDADRSHEAFHAGFSIALFTAGWLSTQNPDFQDYISDACDIIPAPEALADEAVRTILDRIKNDFFQPGGKPSRPDWFKGVIDGGKKDDRSE
jgi:hypothetical protein